MDNIRTMQRRVAALTIMAAAFAGSAWAHNEKDKFRTMDSNGDGMISAAEHAAGVQKMFEQMDADHDGNVTAAEMDAGHAKMMDRDDDMHGMKAGEKAKTDKAMAGHDMSGHGMSGHGMGHDGMMMSSADKIAKMDSNGDGMLSAAEHDAGAAAMFKDMDSNGDGSLSRQEFDAGHKMMMKEGKPGAAR
jgi:Ca2+-binding EF-hand superfamily protein